MLVYFSRKILHLRYLLLGLVSLFIVTNLLLPQPHAAGEADCDFFIEASITLLPFTENLDLTLTTREDVETIATASLEVTLEEFEANETNLIYSRGRLRDLSYWVVDYIVGTQDGKAFLSTEQYPMATYRQHNAACAIRTYGLPEFSEETAFEFNLAELRNEYFNFDDDAWSNITGEGVRIGVIDNCFNDLASDFPATFRPEGAALTACSSGDTQHGSKVLQILSSMAPGAELYYSQFTIGTASETIERFASTTQALIDAEVDIIVYSGNIITLESEYIEYENIVQNAVTENDILWINAAGNLGAGYIRTVHRSGSGRAEFNATTGDRVPRAQITVDPQAASVTLLWAIRDDLIELSRERLPFNLEDGTLGERVQQFVNEFVMTVYDNELAGAGPQLGNSLIVNDLGSPEFTPPPIAVQIPAPNTQTEGQSWFTTNNVIAVIIAENEVPIRLVEARRPSDIEIPLELFVTGAVPADFDPTFNTSYPSIILPPANSEFVLTVGAYDANLDDLTWYTSQSNERQYRASGRIKPDIAVPGTVILVDSNGNPNRFTGTSVSAPILAGVAARVLQYERQQSADFSARAVRDILLRHEVCLLNSNVLERMVGRLQLPLPDELDTVNNEQPPCREQAAALAHFSRVQLPIPGGRFTPDSNENIATLGNNTFEVADDRVAFTGDIFVSDTEATNTTFVLEMEIDDQWGVMPGFPNVTVPEDELSFTSIYTDADDVCQLAAQPENEALRQRFRPASELQRSTEGNIVRRTGRLYELRFDDQQHRDENRPVFGTTGTYRVRLRICRDGIRVGPLEELTIELERPAAVIGELGIEAQGQADGVPIVRDDTLRLLPDVRGETVVGYALEQINPDGSRSIFPGSIQDAEGNPVLPDLSDYPQGESDACPYIMQSQEVPLFTRPGEGNEIVAIELDTEPIRSILLNGTYTVRLVICAAAPEDVAQTAEPAPEATEQTPEATEEAAESTEEPEADSEQPAFISVQPDDPESPTQVTFVINRQPGISISSPAIGATARTIPFGSPDVPFIGSANGGGFVYNGYFVEMTLKTAASNNLRYLMPFPDAADQQAIPLNEETDEELCSLVAEQDIPELSTATLFNFRTQEVYALANNELPATASIRLHLCIDGDVSEIPADQLTANAELNLVLNELTYSDQFTLRNVGGTGTRYDVIGTIDGAQHYIVGITPANDPQTMTVLYGPDSLLIEGIVVLPEVVGFEPQAVVESTDVAEDTEATNDATTTEDDADVIFEDACTYTFNEAQLGAPGSTIVQNGTLASIYPNQYPAGEYRIVIIICLDNAPATDPIYIPNPANTEEPLVVSNGALSLLVDEFEAFVLRPQANLYSGPGTNYRVITTVQETQPLLLVGRTPSNSWFQVELADSTQAWVQSSDVFITLSGFDLNDLIITDEGFRTSEIFYASDVSGMWQIYHTNLNTGAQTQLTFNGNNEFPSVNNNRVVFASNRDGNYNIYIMSDDGTEQQQLTDHSAEDTRPIWSPDGQQILFESDRDGVRRLFVMDTATKETVAVSENIGAPCCVTWSSDGTQIAYSSNLGGNYNIYIANADGSGETAITSGLGNKLYAVWLQDSNTLVYQSDQTGIWQIYTINANGTNERQLTNSSEGSIQPTWTENAEIIFSSYTDGRLDLYIMNRDGSSIRLLVGNEGSEVSGETQQ